jgi:hypothetical protein
MEVAEVTRRRLRWLWLDVVAWVDLLRCKWLLWTLPRRLRRMADRAARMSNRLEAKP